MRKHETVTVDTKQVMTRRTYETDCFRKVTDPETGIVSVKRWVEQRLAGANLQVVREMGAVFHNGAKIA